MLPYIFFAFALLTVGSALLILLTKNVLYAAFSLLLTFLGVAGLYVLAGADYLAITQVMIYVGGILVLMIFGVMLTNKDREGGPDTTATTQHHNQFMGTLAAIGLFTVLLIAILKVNFSALSGASGSLLNQSSVAITGIQLMTGFVLPFEVAAILLMVALISAAYIAGKSKN